MARGPMDNPPEDRGQRPANRPYDAPRGSRPNVPPREGRAYDPPPAYPQPPGGYDPPPTRHDPPGPLTARDAEEPERAVAVVSRVSWGAIFGGTVVVLVLMMTLNMLGLGIGLLSINPGEEANPLEGLGTGAAIWWIASWVVAFFAGGWVAGRLSGRLRNAGGMLHGIVAWGLSSIVVFWVLSTGVGAIVSTTTQATGQVLQLAGRGLAQAVTGGSSAAQGLDPAATQQVRIAARQRLQQSGVPPEVLDVEMVGIERTIGEIAAAAISPDGRVDRQFIVASLSRNTTLSQPQASQVADAIEQQVVAARGTIGRLGEQAEETAGDVANAVGTAAIIAFAVLLIGAIAAGLGGWIGTPHEVLVVSS